MSRRRSKKLHNLERRPSGIWWYRGTVDGHRRRCSLHPRDRDDAIRLRDELERKLAEQARSPFEPATFVEMTRIYLGSEAFADLSPNTRRGYTASLDANGMIQRMLGPILLSDFDASDLHRMWSALPGSTKTRNNHLDSIAGVLRLARIERRMNPNHDPVRTFREWLAHHARTKKRRAERAEAEAYRDARVLRDPAQVAALVAAAQSEGDEPLAALLFLLECGLRRGELIALRWGHIELGRDENDRGRFVRVAESLAQDGSRGPAKGGRSRIVHLSGRLRAALERLYIARFRAKPDDPVFRYGYWWPDYLLRRFSRHAGITPDVGCHALRRTCVSLLARWGVDRDYLRRHLGHQEARTTDLYTRALSEEYVPPQPLLAGQVPADLFARLCVADEVVTQVVTPRRRIAANLRPPKRFSGVPNGNRTRVAALKGRSPRPLDDGDAR